MLQSPQHNQCCILSAYRKPCLRGYFTFYAAILRIHALSPNRSGLDYRAARANAVQGDFLPSHACYARVAGCRSEDIYKLAGEQKQQGKQGKLNSGPSKYALKVIYRLTCPVHR